MRTLPRLGALICVALVAPHPSHAEETLLLRESFPAGYQYHVSTRVELSGALSLPPDKKSNGDQKLTITGQSAIEYDERVLESTSGDPVQKTIRIYRRIDFQRKTGKDSQDSTIRELVRRMVVLRRQNVEVPFSPDGPLTWGEIDLVRTDVFTPALTGLLPAAAVRPGDHWVANKTAVQELTDMERIDEGQVECRFAEVTMLAGRRHARIAFVGTVRGINEDGPNRQQLDGYFFFDLESNHLSYLSLHGTSSLLDAGGKTLGSIEGRFVLTRRAHTRAADLTDEALKGLTLEPNAENTLLLYENPDLNLRLLHPRRWRIAGVHGPQIGLDEANGSGLLLTVEPPTRVPAGPQFLMESREYLEKQKAKVTRVEQPVRLENAPRELERFTLEIDITGQRVVMDYYIVRQPAGGATLAARLLPADLPGLRREVEQIARSVTRSSQK